MSEFAACYDILGVSPEANGDAIKEACPDKRFILHPDRMVGAPKSAQHKAQEEPKKARRETDNQD